MKVQVLGVKFLRYLEKYTKTDMVYLAKGGFWLSIGQGMAMISSFALSVLLARALPQETFGTYKFILSITSIISGLSLSGLGTALLQSVARGKDGTLFLAIRTQLIWTSVLGVTFLLAAGYYGLNGNYTIATSLLIAGATTPFVNCFGMYGSFLNGKKDFKRSTLYWIISHIVNVSVIALIAITTHSVVYLVSGYFVSQLIMTIIFYRKTISLYRPDKNNSDPEMITYGSHLSAINIFGTIANQLDKILVFHFVGAAPLAAYSFAFAIPEQIKASLKNLVTVGVPKLAELGEDHLRKSIIDKTLRLSVVCAAVVALYWIAAPYIFAILFPAYMNAVFYSQLYMIGLIFFPGISLFALYFQLMQQTAVQYKLSIIGNAVTIVLGVVLIARYGTLGAVLENTLSWGVILLVNLIFFIQRGYKIKKI